MSADPVQENAATFVEALRAILSRWEPGLGGRVALAGAGTTLVATPWLADRPVVEERLAVFGRRYPGGDPRAVASLFVQWYAATAWPALVTGVLVLERVPLPAATAVRLDDSGTPDGVVIRGRVEATGVSEGLETLVRGHAAAMVAEVSRLSRLSPRVPWSNLSNVLGWTLERLEGCAAGPALAQARDFFHRRRFGDGAANPLRVRDATLGSARPVRRTCCLRYRLDGVPYCSDCPVPEPRRLEPGAFKADAAGT